MHRGRSTARLAYILCGVACAACSRYEIVAGWNDLRGDTYALDRVSREPPVGSAPDCPPGVATVVYRGTAIDYGGPVRIAAAFEPKLRAFESLVAQLARERYGRAPERLIHFGVRVCRRVRGRSGRLSEHALGNAIDVAGFRFGRGPQPPPPYLPADLARPFTLSVLRHHRATSSHAIDHYHARFCAS